MPPDWLFVCIGGINFFTKKDNPHGCPSSAVPRPLSVDRLPFTVFYISMKDHTFSHESIKPFQAFSSLIQIHEFPKPITHG